MIKILILFAVVVLSASLGIALSNEKKLKMMVFEQFYEFNEKLILNLKYGKEKIAVIAREYNYVERCLNGEKLFKDADGEFISNYVSVIGKSDSLSQIDYLNERKTELNNLKKISRENYKKYSSLYFKLSLMAGILLAVLLA